MATTTTTDPVKKKKDTSKANKFVDAQDLRTALRIAGSNGNITSKEAGQISKQFKVDDARIVQKTDKINESLKARGKDLQIGLGSGYVNSIVKNQPSGWAFDRMMGKSAYGDGALGQAVTKYRDSAYSLKTGVGMVYGSKDDRAKAQSAAGLIPLQRGGAYQINSAGGYSPKASNSAFATPVSYKVPTNTETKPATDSSTGSGTGTSTSTTNSTSTAGTDTSTTSNSSDSSTTTTGSGMLSGGGLGAAGASNLRRANSRLRQLGIYGRGTSLLGRGLQYGNALNK